MSLFKKLLAEGDEKAATAELQAKLDAKRNSVLEFATVEIKKTFLRDQKSGDEGAK
jgi:hypothetical protein